jgi:tyrosyl-tRNA synthetase
MNNFLKEFKERGYFYQCTNESELLASLNKESINAYIGFDSTAPSLHVGSLLQIMCLRLLQKHGHRPIVLLGGGTTRIGDPSGKEETRKILSEKQIETNINNIKKVFKIFLKTNNEKLKPIFVNNYKWLSKLNYINFLRDIGKHFTINRMLTFDSVKLRLDREQSLSYMEFNYMILQAYDFYELNKSKNCKLQIGGSDQWGNIVNGVELIKRETGNHAFGLTTPLITLASGAKMGKTEKGAIWLNKNLLSPYDYWQFWRNTDDRDVLKFLKMFTDLSLDQIDHMKDKNINELKIILANNATEMLHGEIISKPVNRIEALKILKKLNGKVHYLISSVCISKDGSMIWNFTDKASLTMKKMTEEDLKNYLAKVTDENLFAYNVYQIEGEGRLLFSKIEGNEDTIMGLPIEEIKNFLKIIK